MNIVLIGTIGAGKTTIGKALAELSGYKFVDTDELAARKFKSISWNPFKMAREFSVLEDIAINEVATMDGMIIATGALVVSHKGAVEKLRENGLIVRLVPDVQTVINHLKKDGTPIWIHNNMSLEETIEEDYKQHINDYNNYDYSINVSDELSPEEYAGRIWAWVSKEMRQ